MTYKFLDSTGLKQTITQIFSKLKAVALSGSYTDLINKPTIVNNGTTTTTNTVLDGRMGKTLADKDANLQSQITSLNSALSRIIVTDITNATFKYNNEDNLNRFEIAYGLQDGRIALLWWDGVNIAYDFYDGTKWNHIWTK